MTNLQAKLDALGLTARVDDTVETIAPLRTDAEHGFVQEQADLSRVLTTGLDFRPAQLSVATELGMVVERALAVGYTRSLAVSADDGTPLEVMAGPGVEHIAEPDTPSVHYLQFSADTTAALTREDGAGLLMWLDTHGVVQVAAFHAPVDVPAFATLDVNVAQWLDDGDPDWLRRLAADAEQTPDATTVLGAVGAVLRLGQRPGADDAMLERLLAGAGTSWGPESWVAGLSTEQRQTALDLAGAAAEGLADALERLDNCFDGSEAWTAELLTKATRRDDLEGVRVLLAVATGTSGLAAPLKVVDRLGVRLKRIVPMRSWPRDERLTRIAAVDPGAWWGAAKVQRTVEAP